MSAACRLNARLAVELDPVRLADEIAHVRLAAAVCLAPRLTVCRALLAGAEVPAARLDCAWVRELRLDGGVALDYDLALRVVAHGPLAPTDMQES